MKAPGSTLNRGARRILPRPWYFSTPGSWALAGAAAVVVFGASAALQLELERLAYERLAIETEVSASHVAHHLDSWVNDRVRLTGMIAEDLSDFDGFDEASYRHQAERILELYPSFQAINWVSPDGIIERVAPPGGNEGALGRDLKTNPDPRVTESFLLARDTSAVVRTPATVNLYQGGKGFATYWPVINGQGKLLGFVNAVFRVETLVDSVIKGEDILDAFSYRLKEGSGEAVYIGGEPATPAADPFARRVSFEVASRAFEFELAPLGASLPSAKLDPYDLLIPFGIAASLGMGLLVRTSLRYGASLLNSERRYHDLYMTAPSAFLSVDPAMRIFRFNNSAVELTGYSEQDLQRLSPVSLCADGIAGKETVKAIFDRCAAGETVTAEEIHLRRQDGADAWALLSVDPVRNAHGDIAEYRTTFIDITARKRADEALRESGIATRAILDGTLECIVTVDASGNVRTCNAAARELFGIDQLDMVGRPFGEFVDTRAHFESGQLRYGVWDVRGMHADGRAFPMKLSITSIRLKGEPLYTCSMYDVTREKALEHQLLQAQKLEAIGTLAKGIAHDFNNLLHSMLAYIELAAMETRHLPGVSEKLDEVRKAALRARDLIKQILVFSRQKGPERETMDPSLVVSEVVGLMRGSFPPTVEFVAVCPPTCRAVFANPGQLHQLLVNLCTNALQALPDETGKIELGLEEVKIDAKDALEALKSGAYARVWVSDNGSGMDSATQARIFEPYFTTKPVTKGTGLGLATAHGIVKSHGGDIRVRSTPGAGTTFECFFPLHADSPGMGATPERHATAQARHVLLVDDEEIVLRSSSLALERLGYAIDAYLDPLQALDAFRDSPGLFDAVILDLSMPGMRGDELSKRIKESRPDIPIVLCTGFGALVTEPMLRDAGISICLAKPVSMRDLVDALERHLVA